VQINIDKKPSVNEICYFFVLGSGQFNNTQYAPFAQGGPAPMGWYPGGYPGYDASGYGSYGAYAGGYGSYGMYPGYTAGYNTGYGSYGGGYGAGIVLNFFTISKAICLRPRKSIGLKKSTTTIVVPGYVAF